MRKIITSRPAQLIAGWSLTVGMTVGFMQWALNIATL